MHITYLDHIHLHHPLFFLPPFPSHFQLVPYFIGFCMQELMYLIRVTQKKMGTGLFTVTIPLKKPALPHTPTPPLYLLPAACKSPGRGWALWTHLSNSTRSVHASSVLHPATDFNTPPMGRCAPPPTILKMIPPWWLTSSEGGTSWQTCRARTG